MTNDAKDTLFFFLFIVSMYLLWWSFLTFCSLFDYFFTILFWKFFTNYGCKLFIKYKIYKYFLLICEFSIYSHNSIFQRIDIPNFDADKKVIHFNFFKASCFWCYIRNICLTHGCKYFLLCVLEILALGFTVGFMIYFELISAFGVRCGMNSN